MSKIQIGGLFDRDHSPINNELYQLLKTYLVACKVEGKSPLTLDCYYRRLASFLQSLNSLNDVHHITAHHIRSFLLSLHDGNLNCSTINAYYRVLRTFFNWLVDEEILGESPMHNISPPPIPKTKPKPFSLQDINNLLTLCSGNRFLQVRNRAMILMFLDTGLRLAELSGIQLKDMNFDSETIKVMGKGARERVVRMGKQTQKALLRYLLMRSDDYPCLWVTEERKPLTRNGVGITIKRLCQMAQITDATPGAHTFRHTFATTAIRNGANIFYVQSLLGHSTLTMTRCYAATIDSENAVQGHRLFSPVDKMGLK